VDSGSVVLIILCNIPCWFVVIFVIRLKAHRHKLTRYFAGTMKLLIGLKEKFVLLQPAMEIVLTSSLQLSNRNG